MKAADPLSKILVHRHLGVGALRSLKHHSRLLCLQSVHPNKGKLVQSPLLCDELVLELTAHGHNLLKKLPHPMAVKGVVRQGLHLSDLFLLPGLVKNLLSRLDLVFCHILTDRHPLFIQLHDILVDCVKLSPKLQQIHIFQSFPDKFFLNFIPNE